MNTIGAAIFCSNLREALDLYLPRTPRSDTYDRNERQRDAGVAAGRLDEFLARPQQSAFFGVPHHRGADATFDGVGGIASLDFAKDGRRRAVDKAIEPHQRRMAYRFRIIFVTVCHQVLRTLAVDSCPTALRLDFIVHFPRREE